MKELLEYRVKMLERLREAAQELRSACEALSDPHEKVEGEWTAHQLAAHTRDVNKFVYGVRVQQTIDENIPEFKNFDADAWMLGQYDKTESLTTILNEFMANVNGLCDMLQNQPRETWSRISRHETMGSQLTMQLWVERSLAHIEEHLQTLKKVEKQ